MGTPQNEQVLLAIVIQDIHIYMVLLKGILFLFSLKRTKAALSMFMKEAGKGIV